MSGKHRLTDIGILLFIASLIAVGFWAYKIWKNAEEAANLSCMLSIADAVSKAAEAGRIEITNAPRELTTAEIERLLGSSGDLDCRGKSNLSSEIHIAVGSKINEQSELKVKVWSDCGDLVVPLGEKVKVK